MLCGFWTFLLERDLLNSFCYSLKGRRFCCGCVCSLKRKKKKKKQTEVLLLSTINTELGIQTVMSPENASCLEGSLHSSGSSGYTSGRTWGRTCTCKRNKQQENRMSCCNSTCESLKQCELPSIKHTTQIKQIKEQWQTRLIHYPTIIHQLFMTKALFYVKTAPGYWVRCYLVYPSLGAAVTACHKLTRADAEPPHPPQLHSRVTEVVL